MTETAQMLSEALVRSLRKERLVLLSTIDCESGSPTISAISWVYAPDDRTVRFAVDARSRLVRNLQNRPEATIAVFAEGSLYAVYGKARLVSESLAGVPIKLACFDVAVEAVRDAMFYGARISVEPEFEKTYDRRAAEKLDNQVFEAMRNV